MSDLISRQAAIDTAMNDSLIINAMDSVKDGDIHRTKRAITRLLAGLPSIDAVQYTDDEIQRMQDIEQAQIEKAYDIGYAEGKADAEPQWIPCSKRMPEEYGNYLITTHDGNVDIGTIDPKKKSVWSACDSDGFYWLREVVAWMPLPKPYERKES